MHGSTPRAYWSCQLAGWSLYAIANALIAASVPAPHGRIAWGVVWSLTGLPLTHVLRRVIHLRGWAALPLSRLAPRVLAASVVLAAVDLAIGWGLGPAPRTPTRPPEAVAALLLFNLSVVFLGWQLLYFGWHLLLRWRAAEVDALRSRAAAQDAELRALEAQLNPHFLFNALNSIRALIALDPPRAQHLVTRLAALLRHTLAGADAVPLERELEVVRGYLELEAARLEERLRVRLDVPSECLPARVPALLLQSLVENGIKHGVARRAAGGEIALAARLADGALHLEVANSAADAAPGDASGAGIGLANARERLRLLFGAAAALELDRSRPELTVARVRIPLAP